MDIPLIREFNFKDIIFFHIDMNIVNQSLTNNFFIIQPFVYFMSTKLFKQLQLSLNGFISKVF